ncbi:hypothetical protein DYB32_006696 [Aphanomyces invadans]|uniref:DUF155 domain-containing protein n=1 Tax=Aphanomyces invadans TaxID=157072 RepID=A0A418AQJ5_9STRA|nr:hypothetical protein DYB32_006696 [Aphanomyces invadans]
MGVPKLLRVSAYCTCDAISLFKLLKWLERVETGQLPGGELNPNGWTHKMHMGAIHSSCMSEEREEYVHAEPFHRTIHGPSVINDSITLSSFRSSEKIAISFAMAQSSKLDVFEQRVDETIQETRHIPQTLAETGEIKKYSQKDISQLIGRFDINLNSDMLDDPDFFWDDDEYQPLYKKMMKYLDVDNRVHILNTRLDILRELLDVLSQQLARQHDTKLEWIVIWLIVAEVVRSMDVPQLLRVAAYCTCESLALFKLLRWLKRIQTGQLPGGELSPNGWSHKMYMGVIHSSSTRTGCTVFWGLTQAEEAAHCQAIHAFSNGALKRVDVEEMEFCYGDSNMYPSLDTICAHDAGACRVANDVVTLTSFRASEKIAISFAMAQSCKLDVFEERVEETIQTTRHIPQTLADTGEINMYSQTDISKLIGRLFMEVWRSDINLNSDMLDDPDFFWDDDEYQPLYKKMIKYLDVDKRVHILNTRLDVLRELLDVLGEQLARQHDTNLEWIVIWVIVAAVFVKIFWNILVKDLMGLFCH